MRIHTDTLRASDLHEAARHAGVALIDLSEHGSRTRARAFNFGLSGSSSHRTQWGYRDTPAATWDEWGIFLGELYRRDRRFHCGKHSYQSSEHFHWMTGDRFRNLRPSEQHKRHRWDIHHGYDTTRTYAMNECHCGATHRWLINGRWDTTTERIA